MTRAMSLAAGGGDPTATSVGPSAHYAPPALEGTRALSIDTDYLRTDVDALGGEVRDLHYSVREENLRHRTLSKSRKGVSELLEELSSERFMSWSDIAEVVGVSVSAVRKWRTGGSATPDSRSKLAQIAAFLDLLEASGPVTDPAGWMEVNLPLDAGYFIRPLDLYLEGHAIALIELVQQRRTVPEVLDLVRPDWRQERSAFDIAHDSSGERYLRRRDVREA